VTYARVVRSQVLSLREREFIEAARTLGASNVRILFRHLLPNAASPIIVLCTLELARVIQLEATLSFLGLGIPPPTPSWGGLLQEGRSYLASAWWLSTIPGLALMLVSLSVNRIGDWLRDYLDPALRGKIS
jgi:peptide/nickel transport system permease protein